MGTPGSSTGVRTNKGAGSEAAAFPATWPPPRKPFVSEARRNPGPPDGRGDVPEGGQGEDPRGPRGERDAAGGVREVEARVALGLDAPPLGEAGGGGPAGGPAARGEGPGGGAAQARALPGGDGGGGREARLGRGAPRGRRPQARRLVRRAGAVVVQEGRRGG